MSYADLVTSLQAKLDSVPGYEFNSPAELVHLITKDVVDSVTDNNAFIGSMPDAPDLCVAFYDYGGGEQDDRNNIDMAMVQVRSRGNYRTGYKILARIKLVLQSIPKVTLFDGSELVGIWITSSIGTMGRDAQERTEFSMNLRVAIETPNNGNRI